MISVYGEDLSDQREFHVWYNDGSRSVKSDQTVLKQWYKNGQLQFEVPLKNGKPQGKEVWWYKNGQKKYERFYTNDLKNGTFKEWDEEGNIISEKVYDMGKLVSEN